MARLSARLAAVAAIAAAAVAVGGAPAAASVGPTHLDSSQFSLTSFSTASSNMDAGGHPDVNTTFSLKAEQLGSSESTWASYGMAQRIELDLPAGLAGDPTAIPQCTLKDFYAFPADTCPAASQVGVARVLLAAMTADPSPVFNLEHGADEPVLLGINVADTSSVHAFIRVEVRPDGSLMAIADEIPLPHPLISSDVTLWGVPADHNGSGAPRVPFVTAPTECETLATTSLRAFSYDGRLDSAVDSLDTPSEGCENVPFEPVMTVAPTERAAGVPTGLDVELTVPQDETPDGRASAHVRDVELTLPEGMSVSPSSANGLNACSPAEFGYLRDTPVSCPAASKLGSIVVETPVLDEPMSGSVYLAAQNDNPFGSMLALCIVVRGAGQTVKLAGRVDPDPVSGRLTTTFRDNPQLPFSRMSVSIKSGPRAPLVTPRECGTYASETRIVGWTKKVVSTTTPMTVDQGCAPLGFAPSFEAGSTNPVAGRSSAFSLSLSRGDRDRELREVSVSMPEGLLGAISIADQCPAAQAAAGSCGAGSRIGSVTTGAGAGPAPFRLPGAVFLTGPYKGAPFGLSFAVPAVAGPFNLGTVVVRAAVHVDPNTAAVRVVSDPLPSILKGIPVQLSSVDVVVDRPGFMLNPTDCSPSSIGGRLAAVAPGSPVAVGADEIGYPAASGATAAVASRFQVGECAALPFKPRLSLALTGRKQIRTGRHPGVKAVVRQQGIGEAGIEKAVVTLPKSLALDPDNAQALCEYVDGIEPDIENHCPKGSIIGRARAKTPLLDKPLSGDVYFVKNVERNPRTGALIRKLPMIVVALRGEIAINLTGKSSTAKDGRLINTFGSVPDAPISQFNLNIDGGGNGILAVTRTRSAKINLCSKPKGHVAEADMKGQNGKRYDRNVTVKTPCARKSRR